MIQVNELRIGNVVWDKNNDSFFRVDEIAFFPSGQVYELREYPNISTCRTLNTVHAESYPLTEEILLKCGFSGFLFPKIKGPLVIYNDNNEIVVYSYPMRSFCFDKIKYLHQLQNLYFALTGEELEVQL